MSSAPATTPAPAGFTEATLDAFLAERDEPDWMRERREEAVFLVGC